MKLPSRDLEEIEARGSGDWELLAGASILLTGGTGFLGRWLVESFLQVNRSRDLGSRMTILSRNPGAFLAAAPHLASQPALSVVKGDVRAISRETWVPGVPRFDFVIHAAAEASEKLNTDDPLAMIETIVHGTGRILDLASHCGARRFLFVSSGAVYGRQPCDLNHVDEDFTGGPNPLDPRSAYGEAKRLAENLSICHGAKHGLEVTIARGFAFLGPLLPLDRHFAAGNFLRDALEKRSIEIRGDGTPRRSYLYASDLAAWIWRILLRGIPGRAYNVGSEREVSIADLAEEVACLPDPRLPVRIAMKPAPGACPERYLPSISRARSELDLDEWTDRRSALARTYAWYRGDMPE